jgi:hypothetical protein
VQVEVARVLGVDGDGSISQHGFGTRGGDHYVVAGAGGRGAGAGGLVPKPGSGCAKDFPGSRCS